MRRHSSWTSERDAEGETQRAPAKRPLGSRNWLKQFTQTTLQPLVDLNHALVMEAVERLGLAQLTIDVDGSVVRIDDRHRGCYLGTPRRGRSDDLESSSPSSEPGQLQFWPCPVSLLNISNRFFRGCPARC